MSSNIVWHDAAVSSAERQKQKSQKPCLLWYTGLSGSGKSTIANAVDRMMFEHGCHTYLLDGDNVRHGLNADLGFDDNSRKENIRRISEVARLFVDSGLIVSTAFISPFIEDREQARKIAGNSFIEVFIDTPLEICEKRDPKGLYQKARKGEIPHFTGVSSPYEAPVSPEIHLQTDRLSIEAAAQEVIDYLASNGFITVK